MPAHALTTKPAQQRRGAGFTLIELLVVLGIIALLLTVSVPRFFPALDKTRETVLAHNLQALRETIDHYYGDTGHYPDSLDELVEKRYLKAVPPDPMTDSVATWVTVAPDDARLGRVYSVRSGAAGVDKSGRPYAQW